MSSKLKRTCFLGLLLTSIIPFSVNGMFPQTEGDLRHFTDYWGWMRDEHGEWTIGRITHCNDPGDNCIIGPTIEGPCT